MENFYTKIVNKLNSGFSEFYADVTDVFSGPTSFFASIEDDEPAFVRASTFALFVSALLIILSIPSYRMNGVELSKTFYLVAIVITWIFLFIYASQIRLISWLFFGKAGYLKTVSCFFYSSVVMVVGKVAEIPTRIIRDGNTTGKAITPEIQAEMTARIYGNPFTIVSEAYVLVCYVIMFVLLYKLNKTTANFGFLRASVTGFLGVASIYYTSTWLQNSVIDSLLLAFK